MDKTFCARNDFNEGAEIHYPLDLAHIYLAEFSLSRNIIDDIYGLLGCFTVSSSDIDQPGIIYIDLYAGLLYYAPDYLAACSDDIAYFVLFYLHGIDSRCMLGKVCTRRLQGFP